MDTTHYNEMVDNFKALSRETDFSKRKIFLFGHCEATLQLADFLLEQGIIPVAILDNNPEKYNIKYKDIPVVAPTEILKSEADKTVVLIVTRFYEAMNAQLRDLGFGGKVIKLVDFNSFAEYSLDEDVRKRKLERVKGGRKTLDTIKERHPGSFYIFCTFDALGDVYFCMSYLPVFLRKRGFDKCVVCVPSNACARVVRLFDGFETEVFPQKELDAAIQAVIYYQDNDCYIAHQDRPYVIDLHNALKIKLIPLETIYCCGVFGLPKDTVPTDPINWEDYPKLDEIEAGKTLILSPYAKSVTALDAKIWNDIIEEYRNKGFRVFTNVSGSEEALAGTIPLHVPLNQTRSILEKAGTFIGIRSGLCDVIRTAKCRKIAMYPDYNYSDTKWKAIDMYSIDGFENVVVYNGDNWEDIKERINS